MLRAFLSHSWSDEDRFEEVSSIFDEALGDRWENLSFTRRNSISRSNDPTHGVIAASREIETALARIEEERRETGELAETLAHLASGFAAASANATSALTKLRHRLLVGGRPQCAHGIDDALKDIEANANHLPSSLQAKADEAAARARAMTDKRARLLEEMGFSWRDDAGLRFARALRKWSKNGQTGSPALFSHLVNSFSPSGAHPSLQGDAIEICPVLTARIAQASLFVAIYTDRYLYSPWCQFELAVAYRKTVPMVFVCPDGKIDAPIHYRHAQFARCGGLLKFRHFLPEFVRLGG